MVIHFMYSSFVLYLCTICTIFWKQLIQAVSYEAMQCTLIIKRAVSQKGVTCILNRCTCRVHITPDR